MPEFIVVVALHPEAVMFCESCGARIGDQANFCGQCGAAVTQRPRQAITVAPLPPPVTPPPPARSGPGSELPAAPFPPVAPPAAVTSQEAPQERGLAVIPLATLRRGLLGMGSLSCTLVLTQERILVAAFTSAMRQAAARQAAEQARSQGQSWLGQTRAVMASGRSTAERYLHQPAAVILQETSGNFAIPYPSIRALRMEDASALSSTDDEQATTSMARIVIRCVDQSHTFDLPSGQIPGARQALASVGLLHS